MEVSTTYQLLTFYKFVDVDNPKREVKHLKRFCGDIGMRGRIYIGEEGINAQCTVSFGQKQALLWYLEHHELFNNIGDIEEKSSDVDGHKFPKMIVRYKKEIVALGEIYKKSEIDKAKFKASPDELKSLIDGENPEKYLIIDMRNDYEYRLGHFKNARPAGTMSFRETEAFIEDYRRRAGDNPVYMYCTGGIRCEKLAVMLERSGMDGVKQLDGGVIKYVNKFNDGNWLGNLYTFDDRVSVRVGDEQTHTTIGLCHYSGEPTDEIHNCRYGMCNRQIIALPKEYRRFMGFCSEFCAENAALDLNVRDVNFDKFDYKALRILVKNEERTFEEAQKTVSDHLERELGRVQFNHKVPVDEILKIEN